MWHSLTVYSTVQHKEARPMKKLPRHKLSGRTLVTGRDRGSCISPLGATRDISLFPVFPSWSKILSTVKETPTSTGSWQTHPLSIQLTTPAPPDFTFQSKQNNQKWKLWVHKLKSIWLLWFAIPFSPDQEIALLQLDFNIHIPSDWLATLNTLKPYHVLSQEHSTAKRFNRPTLSFG